MPKSPVTREQAEKWGRVAIESGAAVAGFVGSRSDAAQPS